MNEILEYTAKFDLEWKIFFFKEKNIEVFGNLKLKRMFKPVKSKGNYSIFIRLNLIETVKYGSKIQYQKLKLFTKKSLYSDMNRATNASK